jgi:hypothetical protein
MRRIMAECRVRAARSDTMVLGGGAAGELIETLHTRKIRKVGVWTVTQARQGKSIARVGSASDKLAVRRARRSRRPHGEEVYLIEAKPSDGPEVEEVLRSALERARISGMSATLRLLRETLAPQRGKGDPSDNPRPEPRLNPNQVRRWAEIRDAFFREHESVTAPELAQITGSRADNLSARAHAWKKAGRVFSVSDGAKERYPLFQFREGAPLPLIADLLLALKHKLPPWQVAIWLTTPNAWVGKWRRPVDLLESEPERVLEAAGREVEEQVL